MRMNDDPTRSARQAERGHKHADDSYCGLRYPDHQGGYGSELYRLNLVGVRAAASEPGPRRAIVAVTSALGANGSMASRPPRRISTAPTTPTTDTPVIATPAMNPVMVPVITSMNAVLTGSPRRRPARAA